MNPKTVQIVFEAGKLKFDLIMKSQKQELLQLSSITDINLYQYLVLNNN